MWTLPPKVAEYREGPGRRLALELARQESKNPKLEITDYDLDMRCFNLRPWGDFAKHHFLLRAMQHQWGDKFMLEEKVNGTTYYNYWAIRIIEELCRSKLVNLMGAGSSGKTFIASCYCYTVWKSVPFHTSCYLSTTTGEAADTKAWATINQIYGMDKHKFGKMINSTRTLVIEDVDEENAKHRDLRNAVKCVLIPRGAEGKNVVGAISGRKNKRVIWACDEYSHLDTGVMSGRINLFTNVSGGGWAQFISCNNGPHEGSASMIDCEPADGWASINKDVHWRWKTRSGICLYFNGDKSPNMQLPRGEKTMFPEICDWAVRDTMLEASWNDENSPEFWTQFFGFPPSVSIADTVLTKPFLQTHEAFNAAEWAGSDIKIGCGLDLGFRKDGDPCTAHFFQIGKDIRNKTIAEFESDAIILNPSQAEQLSFEEQIAKKFLDECSKDRDCHDVALDVTGDGGIMLQAIEKEARKRNYVLRVVAVSFSGTPDDRIVTPGEKRTAKEIYANKVAQLWAGMRVSVGNGVIRGLGEKSKSVSQLCGRKFHTDEKKRFAVEKKSDFKLRLKRSPDQADATCLGNFLALKMGLSGAESVKPPTPPWVPKPTVAAKPQYASGHSQKPTYGGWG